MEDFFSCRPLELPWASKVTFGLYKAVRAKREAKKKPYVNPRTANGYTSKNAGSNNAFSD